MDEQGDNDGLPGLIEALDKLRRSRAPQGALTPKGHAWAPLGGGAPASDFTTALLRTLVGDPTSSPALRQWVDTLAPDHSNGDRVAHAAHALTEAFPEPQDLLATITDTLLDAGESETLAALLRHTAGAAGLHATHRTTLTALLDVRLLPLCELSVATPHSSLPHALATALVVAPSYAQAAEAISSALDTAGTELLELVLVVNSYAITAWERLAAAVPDTVMFRAAHAAELTRYATNLRTADRYGEAEGAARQAVAMQQELASADPAEYLPDLVDGLNVLVKVLLLRSRGPQAREALDRSAVTVQETLAGREDLASVKVCNALSKLATLADANGCGRTACQIGLLGLDTQLRLHNPTPEQQNAFCESAVVLAEWLRAQSTPADAVTVLERVTGLAEQLSRHDSEFAVTEFIVLKALAAALTEAGRITEAADIARRARQMSGTAAAEDPG
ncbi:hypothetical protein [Streptomyces sp. LN245]|uniref:hypothetical protein n=1 Tax=Streptomyces sp. LN245 TaxID=3112975 RepID=UPI0037194734